MRFLFLSLLSVLAGPAWGLSPEATKGRAVVVEAQCNRCHDITHATGGVPAADQSQHCVDCHTWILGTKGDPTAIAKQRLDFPDWDRYLETIVHFVRLPDLGTLTRRVKPQFVRRFLDGPFDLRPHLEESMIPLRLSPADKDAVVAYLAELNGADMKAPDRGPAPPAERIAAGQARFIERGCPTCHVVGNAKLVPGFDDAFYRAMRPTAALAPNLRYARERLDRATLVRFIQDPAAVDPQTAMPKFPVSPEDAELIADFVLHTPVQLGATSVATPDVPLLPRKVAYDEVHDEILGKICVHCHMNPESNAGDGGAGNTGGLGFAGLKLDLESYPGIQRGLVRDGKAVSVLKPENPGEPPLLLKALLRRFGEAGRDYRLPYQDAPVAGRPTDAVRPGMPLGLPPLSIHQLSLLKTWIAQGAPGPT